MVSTGKREGRLAGIARRLTAAGLLALALGIGGAASARAQARGLRGPDAAFLAGGVSAIATGELDDRLAARGYPTFGRTPRAVGLGAYWVLPGGMMLGGEWHGVILGEEAHDGYRVGLGGGYATLGVGYALELSPRAWVYPRLGLGGGGLGLWIEREEAAVDFDEVLADPRPAPYRQTVLSRDYLVLDLGAGAELLPAGRGNGPLAGLRLGYLATPSTTGWGLYGRPVSGGPAATLAGPYARVVIGWWWGR